MEHLLYAERIGNCIYRFWTVHDENGEIVLCMERDMFGDVDTVEMALPKEKFTVDCSGRGQVTMQTEDGTTVDLTEKFSPSMKAYWR